MVGTSDSSHGGYANICAVCRSDDHRLGRWIRIYRHMITTLKRCVATCENKLVRQEPTHNGNKLHKPGQLFPSSGTPTRESSRVPTLTFY